MQAQQQGFRVGDKAVYPARGVAEVVSIEDKNIAGNQQQFYNLGNAIAHTLSPSGNVDEAMRLAMSLDGVSFHLFFLQI